MARFPRSTRRRVALVVVALVLVIGALGAVAALRAKHHADAASAELTFVEHHVADARTPAGRALLLEHLQAAQADAAAASSAWSSTGVLPALGAVPVLGTELRGASQLLHDAHDTAGVGISLLEAVDGLAGQHGAGQLPVAQIAVLDLAIAHAHQTLGPLVRPTSGLYGPVRSARQQLNTKLTKVLTDLDHASAAVEVGDELLGVHHPVTILVLGANNAEMRDQGIFLSYSLIRSSNGVLTTLDQGPVDALPTTGPADVPASPGTKALFYGSGANRLVESTNLTANFAWSAQTAASLITAATGFKIDDVVALDVPAMAAMLDATGPIEVPGISTELTGENLASIVLDQLYADYPVGSQSTRHDELSQIGSVLFTKVRTDHAHRIALLEALAKQFPSRHLLLWSKDGGTEARIVTLGASGRIDTTDPGASFHVAVESAVAAKIDYFTRVHLLVNLNLSDANDAKVTEVVTIDNTAPAGAAPSYQFGPDHLNSTVPGQYVADVFSWSPRGSVVVGGVAESGLVATGASVSVLPQHQGSVVFVTDLLRPNDAGHYLLRFIPQSRLVPEDITFTVTGPGAHQLSGPRGTAVLEDPVSATFAR